MKKTPFISIITASLNNAPSLGKTLDSVRTQSCTDFEHIVIDGGSKDSSQELLAEQSGRYQLRWISEPDDGIADAMNKGLRLAGGKYLLMLHADDQLFDRHSVSMAVSCLRHEVFDIFSAPVLVEYRDGTRVLRKPYRPLWWYHFKTPFCHQGTLVHRRVFDRVGGFRSDFSIAMDYDFFYRAIKIHPTVLYRSQPLSVMGAYGIGTRLETVHRRIDEEYKVQHMNEHNPSWRIIQFLFSKAYRPYKIRATRRKIAKTL